MSEKPEHHKTLIVRVTETLPIKDADKIEIVKFGLPYQCVSQKGTFKVGDLGVYIQPDSVVPTTEPFRFIWEPYITKIEGCDCATGAETCTGTVVVPEKRRRITVRKMRGEWSEGLLLPISDFEDPKYVGNHDVGADWSDIIGVT